MKVFYLIYKNTNLSYVNIYINKECNKRVNKEPKYYQ